MTRIPKLCLVSAGLVVAVAVFKMSNSAEQLPTRSPQSTLTSPEQRTSYALGVMIGQDLKSEGLRAVPELIGQGIVDVFRGRPLKMSQADLKTTLQTYQRQMQARREAQAKAAAAKNREVAPKNRQAAAAFLAANKKKRGVVTLPSGLQYQVLRAGKGASPAATNTVKVHYHGTLANGTVFDSSVKRGEPIDIPLNGVIPGWTEALTKMKVGGKWRLFIPPDLAYGDNPRPGGPIGPGMLLIFEVELLDIIK